MSKLAWRSAACAGILLALGAACGNSRNYTAKGDAFFAQGKYADAAINYRKAIQKDPDYGDAYYGLGRSAIKMGNAIEAYTAFDKAVLLLPGREDIAAQLADLALAIYAKDRRRPAELLKQVARLSDRMLARDARSYDGLRLKGALAAISGRSGEAAEFFRNANAVKPLQPDVILAWSEMLFAGGSAAEGEAIALNLIAAHKDYGPIYDSLFRAYTAQGRQADALNILRAKTANNPGEIQFALQLAHWYADAGRSQEMAAVLQQILSNPNAYPDVHLWVGNFYAGVQEWALAEQEYQAGAREQPKKRVEYLKLIVDIKLSEGQGQQAADLIGEILKADPMDESALAVRATMLVSTGVPRNIDAGIHDLEKLVEKNPGNSVWRLTLGNALASKGDLRGAGNQFREAIKARADLVQPRLALAQIAQIQGDSNETLRYANEILSVRPDVLEARLLAASALTGLGRFKEARQALTRLEAQVPSDDEVQFQLAALDAAEKRFDDAERRLQRLVGRDAARMRALQGIADVYVAAGRADKAYAFMGEELKRTPGSEPVRDLYAAAALRDGKYDEALAVYQELLASNPKSAKYERLLGSTYQLKRDSAHAIAAFRKALDLAPRDPAATAALADSLRLAGQRSEAIATYRRLLDLAPDNPSAMNNLAFLYVEGGGDIAEAQKLVERALQRVPNQPDYVDTLGLIYRKRNLRESASQTFAALTVKYPENPIFHYHYGLALLDGGEGSKAKGEFQAALLSHPPDDIRTGAESAMKQIR